MHNCDGWLSSILDNHEARPESGRAKALRPEDFESVREFELLKAKLTVLIEAGALKPHFGKHARRKEIEKVSLLDPTPIYSMLGRKPSAILADEAIQTIRIHAQDWEASVLDEIEDAWRRNKPWQTIKRDTAEALLPIQRLSQGLHAGKHGGRDQRSFAAKEGDNSKLLETKRGLIASYMFAGQAAPLERLESLLNDEGSRKIALPITMSGPISLNGEALSSQLDYHAIPFHQIDALKVSDDIEYVLTIENMTSFHRHALEINLATRNGLVLYTGGQPSTAFKEFYRQLVTRFDPKVPFYHWSDIDVGGLEITNTLLGLNPNLRLHLMDVELVENHGVPTRSLSISVENFYDSVLEPLARFLSRAETKTLEQEKIDPVHPH